MGLDPEYIQRMLREAEIIRRMGQSAEQVRKAEQFMRDSEAIRKMMPPTDAVAALAYAPPEMPPVPQVRLPDGHMASGLYDRLTAWIQEFEEGLDADHEVGVRLVAFGQALVFHLTQMSWWNPALIRFDGFDDAGNPVQLIQHISQISVLLHRLPKQGPEARKVGFVTQTDGEEPDEEP